MARPRNNLLFLFAFIVLVIGSIAVAYTSGGPPNVIGHSSDEVSFIFDVVTNDCSALPGSTCIAACPTSTSSTIDHIVSGGCISAAATRNRQTGACTAPNCGASVDSGWVCQDASHVTGQEFIAYARCIKGGQ